MMMPKSPIEMSAMLRSRNDRIKVGILVLWLNKIGLKSDAVVAITR